MHRSGELPVEFAGDVALEAAADFPCRLSLGGAPGDVGAGAGAAADPGHCDGVDGAVEGAVAAAVEPVPDGLAATARRMLDHATGTVDGKIAAASTGRRHRTILANAMDYAIERGLLETNPVRALKWTAPKVSGQVDRRSVVNPHQARALLDAVRAQQPSGPRLVAFFAVMYYAGLRPEEAINLSTDNVLLLPCVRDADHQRQGPPDDQDWGELHLRGATPDAGSEWTDDGRPREHRQLKHRAEGCPPG